jgi:hypothetical protein
MTLPELVLSSILSDFSFGPAPEKVNWKMGITMTPYVEGREKEGPMAPIAICKLK